LVGSWNPPLPEPFSKRADFLHDLANHYDAELHRTFLESLKSKRRLALLGKQLSRNYGERSY
jgi:hypothetical protein